MTTKKIISTFLIATCILSLALFAGCKQKRHDNHHEFAIDYIEDVLDLTDEQKILFDQYEKDISTHVTAIKANHHQMYSVFKEEVSSDEINVVKMKQMAADHRKMTTEVVDITIERLAELHKQLSPEQKDKLLKKMDKFERWHLNDD